MHDNKLWVIGGRHQIVRFENDVWRSADGETLDLEKWDLVVDAIHVDDAIDVDSDRKPEFVSGPFPPRQKHGFVSYNNRLWVIGGHGPGHGRDGVGGLRRYNDVWRSEDGVNWRLGVHDVFEFQ